MKRYRILHMDFDTRATHLGIKIEDSWEPHVKDLHQQNKSQIREELLFQFGIGGSEQKIQSFLDLGPAPFSVIAFHNRFLRQLRNSFVIGSFYPSLTAACALGERVLNHLLLKLRDFYRSTPEYKTIYRKESFDNWDVPIDILGSWGVLLPKVSQGLQELKDIRNQTLHFDPDTDHNDRALALEAIKTLSVIIEGQFGAYGQQPWFIRGAVGTSFIKQSYENVPFIKVVYLPNSKLVGPLHTLECVDDNWIVHDDHPYEDRTVTDEQFIAMANGHTLNPEAEKTTP